MAGTRNFTFTAEETRLLMQWAGNAWKDADAKRLLAPIDSPQEKAALDDQLFIEKIQRKLTRSEPG